MLNLKQVFNCLVDGIPLQIRNEGDNWTSINMDSWVRNATLDSVKGAMDTCEIRKKPKDLLDLEDQLEVIQEKINEINSLS